MITSDKLTRFEIIDHCSITIECGCDIINKYESLDDLMLYLVDKHCYPSKDINFEFDIQDEGRTLKVFLSDKKEK